MASQLVRLPHVGRRIYFGFSAAINLHKPKALDRADECSGDITSAAVRKVLAVVPASQVLLESDQSRVKGADRDLTRMCEVFAAAWGVTPHCAAEITHRNALRWQQGQEARVE